MMMIVFMVKNIPNSTHCMDKFDIYNHPTNKTVPFIEKTSCHPSLSSLDLSSPNWSINDSVFFM